MIMPVRTSGSRPPLFLLHDASGITGLSPALADSLGSDQPLYFVNARGLDGAQPPCTTVRAMATAAWAAIRQVFPRGPYLIGGVGKGSFIALEVMRELNLLNREAGPVLLIDPGPTPHRSPAAARAADVHLERPDVRRQLADHAAARFRHSREAGLPLPFDPDDAHQLRCATAVSVATQAALTRHRAMPYYGASELIVTWRRARTFFDPLHEWQKVLPARRTFHVLEGDHADLFTTRLGELGQMIAIYLDSALETGDAESPETARR